MVVFRTTLIGTEDVPVLRPLFDLLLLRIIAIAACAWKREVREKVKEGVCGARGLRTPERRADHVAKELDGMPPHTHTVSYYD